MSLADALDTPPPDPISGRTLAFCRLLRAEGLPITPARVMDALRALTFIDSSQVDDFRLALRINLASSQTQEATFDRVFTHYFYDTADERRLPSGIRGETMRGQLGHHYKALDQAVDAPPEAWAPEASGHAVDLRARWDPDAPPLEQIIRELACRLATRPSRRFQTGRRGEKVDLRRSVRRNARHGFDLLDLARARRKQRRTRLVMLCDVSGSMDAFNPFLLQLMFGLQQALKSSRTLVFSTHVTEITAALRRRSVAETLREITQIVRHWSGGTDIGAALGCLNRGVIREGAASSTVAIIISDGYDNGSIERIAEEMKALQRQVSSVVWINPMYGASTFQVRAAGMRAALPFVDHFLPAFDARSLRVLVRALALI